MGEFTDITKGIIQDIENFEGWSLITLIKGESLLKIPFYGLFDRNLSCEVGVLKERVAFPGPEILQEIHVVDYIYFGSSQGEELKRAQREYEKVMGY